jgi:Family of unknown function (DUF6492)
MRIRHCNIWSSAMQRVGECIVMVIARRINQFASAAEGAGRFGTDLALSPPGNTTLGNIGAGCAARETSEMNAVALLTPTYGRDLELCTLLCESVDRHVSSFSKHYLLVPDCDLSLFSHFESPHRSVLPASMFLPDWLRPLPRIIQRKRRQYWWSFRAKPASGWHVQQLIKIAATMSLPHERYCILDSDIVFFRDFDLARFEVPNSIPLLNMPGEVTSKQIRHARWVETSHQLLGLPKPLLPASDYIGHIIFWDRQTARAMAARIEEVTRLDWVEALCRTREFSEYMLYGYFVQNDARFADRHTICPRTQCVSYWDQPKLCKSELNQLLCRANKDDVAFSVASFSGTPVQTIRDAVEENEAVRLDPVVNRETAGLVA